MKRNALLVSLLPKLKKSLVIAILTVVFSLFSSNAFCEPKIGFDSSYVKANVPEEALYSYETDKTDLIDSRKAKQIAEKLLVYTNFYANFADLEEDRENEQFLYRSTFDPTAMLDINTRTGEFIFDKGIASYNQRGNTPDLPDEKDAVSLAKKYLKDLDLLPEEDELTVSHVGGLAMSEVVGGRSFDYKKLVTVYFGRKLNNVPVIGVSRIVVDLGSNGELTGVIRNWRKINKSKTKKLSKNTFLDAKARYSKIRSQFKAHHPKAKAIKIKESQFILYDDGSGIIEPAIFSTAELVVEGVLVAGDKKTPKKFIFFADELTPLSKKPRAKYSYMEMEKVPVFPSIPFLAAPSKLKAKPFSMKKSNKTNLGR